MTSPTEADHVHQVFDLVTECPESTSGEDAQSHRRPTIGAGTGCDSVFPGVAPAIVAYSAELVLRGYDITDLPLLSSTLCMDIYGPSAPSVCTAGGV